MNNIYIRLDYIKYPNVRYSYSYNSKDYTYSILYKLDTIKYKDNGDYSFISIQHKPHPLLLSKLKNSIFEFVNSNLLPDIIAGNYKKEYILECDLF